MKKTIFLLMIILSTSYSFSQTAEDYFYKGVDKYKLEDYRGAIADYSKAIELKPDYADVYFFRGIAKLLLNQKDSGCLDLSKAGELGYSQAYDSIREFCN